MKKFKHSLFLFKKSEPLLSFISCLDSYSFINSIIDFSLIDNKILLVIEFKRKAYHTEFINFLFRFYKLESFTILS